MSRPAKSGDAYRTGNHWGVTIVREEPGASYGEPGGDPHAELVAVVVNGDQELAERICALLNGSPYPPRCTFIRGERGCLCEPWPDCRATSTPDVDYLRGAAEALALVADRIADAAEQGLRMGNLDTIREILEGVAAELGADGDTRHFGPLTKG